MLYEGAEVLFCRSSHCVPFHFLSRKKNCTIHNRGDRTFVVEVLLRRYTVTDDDERISKQRPVDKCLFSKTTDQIRGFGAER